MAQFEHDRDELSFVRSAQGVVQGADVELSHSPLACSLSPRTSARCFFLSIPYFVLRSMTEMRALYPSIGFSSPLQYMLMTAFTILDIVLCKSKRTAIKRSCQVTRDD